MLCVSNGCRNYLAMREVPAYRPRSPSQSPTQSVFHQAGYFVRRNVEFTGETRCVSVSLLGYSPHTPPQIRTSARTRWQVRPTQSGGIATHPAQKRETCPQVHIVTTFSPDAWAASVGRPRGKLDIEVPFKKVLTNRPCLALITCRVAIYRRCVRTHRSQEKGRCGDGSLVSFRTREVDRAHGNNGVLAHKPYECHMMTPARNILGVHT